MNVPRVGRAQLHGVRERLSDRDLEVLESLAEHRFLTTGQLQRLSFAGHRSPSAGIRACVRVLHRLERERLITRLARRIGGLHAGSRAFVWCLDSLGARFLHHGNVPGGRRRTFEPTLLFLEHTLAVAELRVAVVEAARLGPLELLSVQTEPACWREYVDPYGRPAVLKPDLALQTALGDYEDHWFVEVDRGTESVRRVLAKCEQYERYRRTGREQAEHGVFPLVVWVVPDERRRQRLEEGIRSSHGLDPALYRVVLPTQFTAVITGHSPPPGAINAPPSTDLTKGGTP